MYFLPVFKCLSKLVEEKEVRELMKAMGNTDLPYWSAWFIYYTFLNTLISLAAWGLLMINVVDLSNETFAFVLLWLWLYGQALFGQIIIIQSLLSRSQHLGLFSAFFYLLLVLANIPIQSDEASKLLRFCLAFIPQVALQQMCSVYVGFDNAAIGITLDTVNAWYFNYTFLEGLVQLAIALPLWSLFGLYIDKVVPRKYGRRESCCFVCSPWYWGCCRARRREITDEEREHRATLRDLAGGVEALFDNFEARDLKPEYYEPVEAEVAKLELEDKFLQISGLNKSFGKNSQAVNGINVKLHEGNIFALLGHNGAGKTTMVSMLAGLVTPTSGKVSSFEHELFEDMHTIRKYLGICPQHQSKSSILL